MIGELQFNDTPFMEVFNVIPTYEHPEATKAREEIQRKRIEYFKSLPKFKRQSIDMEKELIIYRKVAKFNTILNNSK